MSAITWIILGMSSANERTSYIVTPLVIGWVHNQIDPFLRLGVLNVEDPVTNYMISEVVTIQ